MKRVRFVPTGACVLATCVASLLGTSAIAADLRGPDEPYSYKDGPAIAGGANWAGFYAGGHIGGRWGNGGQSVSVSGGDGGTGGGGGGDNNWVGTDTTKTSLINGADGIDGGLGGNTTANLTGVSNPGRRLGGNGGAGGQGGEVSGEGDDGNGVIGGLHLGYNWQRRNIVFGVEGDVSFDGALDNYLASLRGRIGVARENALFYITGGLAIRDSGGADAIGLATGGGAGGDGAQNDDGIDDRPAEATHPTDFGGLGGKGASGSSASASGFSGKDKGSDTGFVVGAGAEYMLSSNVSVGLEGLYYSFDEEKDISVLRARLTYHLNGVAHESFKDSYLSASIANWSGFYVGGNAGAGFGSGKRIDSVKTANGAAGTNGGRGATGHVNNPSCSKLNQPCPLPQADGIDDPGGAGGGGGGGAAALVSLTDDSGALGGIHAGYNWQRGATVFGIEGDANLADENFREYLASVRVRVGRTIDQVLVYGTAGVAFARSAEGVASVSLNSSGSHDGTDGKVGRDENDQAYNPNAGAGGAGGSGDTASVTKSGEGEDKVGFVVGGGFEVKLWDRTSFGVEGLYYGFDGSDGSSTSTSYDAGDDLSSAVVRGRLTFHLDGDAETDSLK